MSFFLKAFLAIVVGTALGLGATKSAVDRGFVFGMIPVGPWIAFPSVGSTTIDPYAKAVLSRTAFAPIGADEGVALTATIDSDGRALRGACDYSLESAEPSARFWTLSLYDSAGSVLKNEADRYALSSQDVVRFDGRLNIALSSSVKPGNWLPTPPSGPFRLIMTLYESNSGTAAAAVAEAVLPTIRRLTCRA